MKVMQGVKVLEVAQYTFVPVASAILAEWGAEVIKVETPGVGDTQRGFINLSGLPIDPNRHILMEHANRGKRSIGIDLRTEEGQQILYKLAADCDIFLTNYLPAARRKFKMDFEDLRVHNPDIIYVRGSSFGDKGDQREMGGYDSTAFWARGGSAAGVTPAEMPGPLGQPGGAYGDSIGGMNIAGGMAAALFHRERTGEGIEVDVSLLGSGAWATALTVSLSMEFDVVAHRAQMPGKPLPGNPLIGSWPTADGKFLTINILTPDRHLHSLYEHLGLQDMIEDARFNNALGVFENQTEVYDRVAAAIAGQDLAYWSDKLKHVGWQWAVYNDGLSIASDEQVLANDVICEVDAIDGGKPIKLVASPVQFNREAAEVSRAPQAFEHTELIMMELGYEWDAIEAFKESGVIG